MNVLHVYRTYFPDSQGGLEEVIRQISLNTKPLGIKSRVLTLSKKPVPCFMQREEADVYRYKLDFEIASCGFSLSALKAFKTHVQWADVINYHFPWPFADILHFSHRVDKPIVITYHSDIVRQQGLLKIYKPLMRKFLASADRIIATSLNYRQSSQVLADYLDKTTAIPIGLNKSSYPELDNTLKKKLKRQYGEGFFLFIGMFRYYKGLKYLIEAVKNTPLKVVIAGSGPEENNLRQLAESLTDNVLFAGQITDEEKVALIHLSKALVLPSIMRSEAFGVTLLEGAMYGKPLISTELGTGTSYVNQNGITGFVVPTRNIKELGDAMDKINEDDELAFKLGQASSNWYESNFTGAIMAEKYDQLYREVNKCVKMPVLIQ